MYVVEHCCLKESELGIWIMKMQGDIQMREVHMNRKYVIVYLPLNLWFIRVIGLRGFWKAILTRHLEGEVKKLSKLSQCNEYMPCFKRNKQMERERLRVTWTWGWYGSWDSDVDLLQSSSSCLAASPCLLTLLALSSADALSHSRDASPSSTNDCQLSSSDSAHFSSLHLAHIVHLLLLALIRA